MTLQPNLCLLIHVFARRVDLQALCLKNFPKNNLHFAQHQQEPRCATSIVLGITGKALFQSSHLQSLTLQQQQPLAHTISRAEDLHKLVMCNKGQK